MKKSAVLLAVGFAVLSIFGWTPATLAQEASPESEYAVSRCIDGDTIQLENGETVRYIGVNAPETKHPTKQVERYGKEAAAFNEKLIKAADSKVRLQLDVQERDKYGRLLAYVFIPWSAVEGLPEFKGQPPHDVLVNAELVRLGFAQVMTVPPNVMLQSLFVKLQREARNARRGLWGKEPEKSKAAEDEDRPQYIASNKSDVFHTMTCMYADKIKPSNRIYFGTRDEAAASGRRPCKRCKP